MENLKTARVREGDDDLEMHRSLWGYVADLVDLVHPSVINAHHGGDGHADSQAAQDKVTEAQKQVDKLNGEMPFFCGFFWGGEGGAGGASGAAGAAGVSGTVGVVTSGIA